MILYPTNITPWRHILILCPCTYWHVQVPPEHFSRFPCPGYLLHIFSGSFVQVPPACVSRFLCPGISCAFRANIAWLIYAFSGPMSRYLLFIFWGSHVQVPPSHVSRSLCLLSRYLPAHVLMSRYLQPMFPGPYVLLTPDFVSRFLCPDTFCPCF